MESASGKRCDKIYAAKGHNVTLKGTFMQKAGIMVFIYSTAAGNPLTRCAIEYAEHAGIVGASFDSVARDSNGKPFFPDGRGIEFSVSHSEGLWACGFCTTPIGIDIQWHKSCNRRAIAKRFFHPLEYEYLLKTDFEHFFDVWTAKESYVKYTGRGISDEFSEFSVTDGNAILKCIEGAFLNIRHIRPDYTLSVCTNTDGGIIIFDRS